MKKKIAVIANGWYNRGLSDIMKGITAYTGQRGIDVFLFLTYSTFRDSVEYNDGEFNIHRLPKYDDYDGVIFIPDSLSSPREAERLRSEFVDNGVKAVSVGTQVEGLSYVSCNNYESMCVMCRHLAKDHDIKRAAFIAGHKDNAESNERLNGCRDTFDKYGIRLDDRDVFYCNWEYEAVVKAAKKIATDKRGLPDVIVCANDVGAMAVCATLENMGYSIPKDVKVTGYDNVYLTRAFSPSITTMAQPYEEMGYDSALAIYEMAQSDQCVVKNSISKLIIGESCGCAHDEAAVSARKKLAAENFLTSENNIIFERTSIDIENAIFKSKSYEDLSAVLQEYFKANHEYERDGFAIVLKHAYAQNIYSDDTDLKEMGYGRSMKVVVALSKNKAYGIDDFETKDLIPQYKNTKGSHVYVISSLHSRNNIFGYVIMKDVMDHVEDRSLYAYMSRLGESFEKYRKIMRLDQVNARLRELSVKDSLTGLYNRYGYDSVIRKRYINDLSKSERDVIIFIDINRLKYINDTFGHLQGDMAIRTIGTVINECIPKEWVAIRYGGDEFLIFGALKEEPSVDYLCERLTSTIEKRGEELRLPYRLSASCGHLVTDPSSDMTLEQYVETADKYMYENKRRSYLKEQQ